MIVRYNNANGFVFNETPRKALYARADQVEQVIDVNFGLFTEYWEYDNVKDKYFEIDPVEGWYTEKALTEEQKFELDMLLAAFNDIKNLDGVTGEEW
jgi:hypothetical protein